MFTVRAFRPLMTQRITISPNTGYDNYGEPTYGTGVIYQGALIGEMRLVRNAAGQEVPSRQTFYMMSNAAIRPEDQITLSTSDVGSTESYAIHPQILGVGRYPFTRGQYCTVIHLM